MKWNAKAKDLSFHYNLVFMYDIAGLSSSVETIQCQVQAAHTHAGSHWREAIRLQGESSLSPTSVTLLRLGIVRIVTLEDCQMGSKVMPLMSDCPLKSDTRVSFVI